MYCHWQKYSAKPKCSKNQFIRFGNTVTDAHCKHTLTNSFTTKVKMCDGDAPKKLFWHWTRAHTNTFKLLLFVSPDESKINNQPWTMSTKGWIPLIQQWFFITLSTMISNFQSAAKMANDQKWSIEIVKN